MILRALFLGASLLGMTPIMVTCQGASGPAPSPSPTLSPTATPTPTSTPTATPSPTPTPTATPTSTPTPTAAPTVAGIAPAAYYSYATPVPTTLPSTMPTSVANVNAFYGELQPYPLITPNPFATTLTMTNPGSGADVVCTGPYPRNSDGFTAAGATGYIEACVNNGSANETVAFRGNQSVDYDSWDHPSNIDDSSSGDCPGFTVNPNNDGSFHNCAVVITVAANTTFTLSGTNAMRPGEVRFFRLFNGAAPTSASPTPVPAVTPTAAPTEVPPSFPSDYPSPYQTYLKALIAPVPFTTYYPYTTGPTVVAGGTTSGFESFQYVNSAGEVFYVPYFPQPSATPNTFQFQVTNTQPGAGAAFIATTALLPTPTSSPCTYGGGGLVLPPTPGPSATGSTNSYGICVPSIIQFNASPPTPNPSPTIVPYPGATAAGCPTNIVSTNGASFVGPPMSRQCMFNQNAMNGILPANATPDPLDSDYMANSGVGNGPAPLKVVGTIKGSGASSYSYNWVQEAAPSVHVNLTCSPGPCGTMASTPIWIPTDFQQQGPPDCHTELVHYTLGYIEDLWQVNKFNTPICAGAVYPGAPFTSVTASRISMNSDGAHSSGSTASTISAGIGLFTSYEVLDSRVSTFKAAVQIAPPCTNAFARPPSYGSDAGVGSNCNVGDGVQPPTGSFIYYKLAGASSPADTLNHIAACNLDILSTKFWNSMVPGWGHGLIITDTNGGGSSGYYVQAETDRDFTRFGVSSGWQVVAKMMGVSIAGDGTYSLPISTGGGCIAQSDVHFLSQNTPPVTGAAAGIAVAP